MRWLLFLAVAACSSASRGPAPPPVANQATAPPIEDAALSREVIMGTPAPADLASAQRLVVGTWNGRSYDYDVEHDFAGEAGDASDHQMSFTSDGRYRAHSGGCDSDGRYEIAWAEGIELRLYREHTCHGDPPYSWPNYIYGLDAGVLVLVDGMTAALSAYRRVR